MSRSWSKSTVDVGSAGSLNVGKLIPSVVALNVWFKTVDHLPIMSALNSGAAGTDLYEPATVDTFGSTEGVSEGRGSGD